MSRSTTTNGYTSLHDISVDQQRAVDLIVTGKSDTDVADAVGVHRVTVTRWRRYHPGFQAALNTRRRELWEANGDRLRRLASKAVDVIERELDAPDPSVRVALDFLKLAGVDRVDLGAVGETDPHAIIGELAREEYMRIASPTDMFRDGVVERLQAQLDAPVEA